MENNSRFNSHKLIDNRQIRIFLSSTFADMKEERAALIKIFDMLRIKANRRNVDLCIIDLRWGVTEEESRSGKTISVWLNEIERSYPFFIGLLGNHYGSILDASVFEKNPELKERYPWLVDDIAAGRSITEIEILYGVLRNKENQEASFYLKQTSDPDDDPRLSELKMRIRQQQRCPVSNYSTIEELCNKVETGINKILDRYFPETEISSLDRERTAQRAYINSRHTCFVGREKDLSIIDDFVNGESYHLVINGKSGMGKSALLARWVRLNEKNNDFNLVYHFIGNSFADSNYESILRHLCDEITDIYQIEKESVRGNSLEEKAQHLVNEVELSSKPLVVVIDGINQLIAPTDEKLLLWLPAANKKVKFIFTTLKEDDTMRTFERLGYLAHTLRPLSKAQRRRFAIEYLDRVGKHLTKEQWQRILSDEENNNTLVLRTLLDELICFGSHKQLDKRINYYLAANGIRDFFDLVLKRMEKDYGKELVCHTLTLLAISERGLSENELLTITGFRQIDWNLFFSAFFNHLVVREGQISFSHQYVATAIAIRYTNNNSKVAKYRHELVSYFEALQSKDDSMRQHRIFELAYQYYNLADWLHLHDLLVDRDAFWYFDSTDEQSLAKYWQSLLSKKKRKYSLSDYLNQLIPKDDISEEALYNDIGLFVSDYFADYHVAEKYYIKALSIHKEMQKSKSSEVATYYSNLGTLYENLAMYDKSLEYNIKALTIRENDLGLNHPDTASSYNNIGLVYYHKDDYSTALEYLFKALEIWLKTVGRDSSDTATTYNNIGIVYYYKGDYKKALENYKTDLEICEKTLGTNHISTVISYDNVGVAHAALGDFSTALEYHYKALDIREKILGHYHPDTATTYNNIGGVYSDQEDYFKALEYYFKALKITKKVLGTKHPATAITYNNIGCAYSCLGDYPVALKFHLKALAIKKEIKANLSTIASSYINIGEIYSKQGDFRKALKYKYQALKIQKKVLGNEHPDTATTYNNIACTYAALGQYDKALELFEKVLRIWEVKLGYNHPDTQGVRESIDRVKTEMEKKD